MERQPTVNKNNPESFFFSRIQDILDLCNLPPIHVLVDALPTKFAWKRGINLNIAEKWTNKLSEEIEGKSTMKLCSRDLLKIHGVHSVWSSLPSVTHEVKKPRLTPGCSQVHTCFNLICKGFRRKRMNKNVNYAKLNRKIWSTFY